MTYHGANNQKASGTILPNGNYTVSDPPVGLCQITLEGVPGNRIGSQPGDGHSAPVPGAGPRPSGIPKKYARPGNGLSHEVVAGTQTRDLELSP